MVRALAAAVFSAADHPLRVRSAGQDQKAGVQAMRRFTVSLAGATVGVESLYDEVYALCEPYLCQGAEDFSVSVRQADIEFEKIKND